MIPRAILPEFHTLLGEYPVVTVLGPRQAGKTTLVREALPHYKYVSLEDPDTKEHAIENPRGFLKTYSGQTIFDEVQRAPKLLNYIQGIVDSSKTKGQFVLTGSHQLELRFGITQSLAGRTGILNLYPLSIAELADAGTTFDRFEDIALLGTLPRVHDEDLRPLQAYRGYFRTYVERDVSQLINLRNVALFEKFLKLLAGRVGQLVDFTSLGNDVGADRTTIREWISILEASFIIHQLPPYFENFGKRATKSPKIYFLETGLLCYLLGIETAEQLSRDPLVGNIFENLIVTEALKARANQGKDPALYFYRDSKGNEIDLLHGSTTNLTGIEIKSSSTYNRAFRKSLDQFHENTQPLQKKLLVYNGEPKSFDDGFEALSFDAVAQIF